MAQTSDPVLGDVEVVLLCDTDMGAACAALSVAQVVACCAAPNNAVDETHPWPSAPLIDATYCSLPWRKVLMAQPGYAILGEAGLVLRCEADAALLFACMDADVVGMPINAIVGSARCQLHLSKAGRQAVLRCVPLDIVCMGQWLGSSHEMRTPCAVSPPIVTTAIIGSDSLRVGWPPIAIIGASHALLLRAAFKRARREDGRSAYTDPGVQVQRFCVGRELGHAQTPVGFGYGVHIGAWSEPSACI